MANAQNPGSSRGFAAMDPNKQRQIASMGGKAAHAKGAAHEFTSAEAREAGRKGGLNSHARKNGVNAGTSAAATEASAQMVQSAPQALQPQQSDTNPPQPG